MGVRFYLPNTGAAAVSPAFASEWDFTTGADRIALVRSRISSTMTSKAVTDSTATANRDALARQYVSGGLIAQTISGTVKGQIRAQEGASSSNLAAQVIIRVVDSTGTTVRGTLYAGNLATGTSNPTSEFGTSLTNRQFPTGSGGVALTSVTAQAGDRLVIEVGYRKHAAASTTGTFSFGDDNATDLPEDETTTAANNPWIEFSGPVVTQAEYIAPTTTGAYATAVTGTSGLAGYWRLGETSGQFAFDETSNGNHGLNTAVTQNATGLLTGDSDPAYTFNGTSSRIDVGNPASLQLGTGTLRAWIKSTNTTGTQIIAEKPSAWDLYTVSGVLTSFDWGASTAHSTGVNVCDGNPHQIDFTFQSGVTNGSTIYVDGVSVLTFTLTPASLTNSFVIATNGTNFWSGTIDEVAVWNVALSGATIASHYATGSAAGTPVSLTDSGTPAVTDVTSIAATTALTDSGTPVGTDTLAISATPALSDAGTPAVTESLSIGLALTDSAPITGSDSLAVAATLLLTDAGTPAVTDALTVAAAVPLTDGGLVAVTEASTVAPTVALSDAPTVAATDSLAVLATTAVALTDSAPISGSDALTLTATVPMTDAGTPAVADTLATVATLPLNDTGTPAVGEALAPAVTLPLSDSAPVGAADTLDVSSEATVALSDGGAVTVMDALAVITESPVTLTDGGTVANAEQLSAAADTTLTDAVSPTAAEVFGVATAATLADVAAVAATEATSIAAQADMADSGAVAAGEAFTVLVAIAMDDAGTVTVTDALGITLGIPIVPVRTYQAGAVTGAFTAGAAATTFLASRPVTPTIDAHDTTGAYDARELVRSIT